MSKKKIIAIVVLVLVILIVLALALLDLYTDLAWFQMIGVTSTLWRRLTTEWLLFLGGWLIATGMLAGNWRLARHLAGGGEMTIPWLRPTATRGRPTAEPTRRILAGRVADLFLTVGAAALGLFFALTAQSGWLLVLRSLHATPFGQTDPILNRDIGYYVFELPWFELLQGWLLWLFALSLIGAALVYVSSYAARQLTAKIQLVGVRQPWLRLWPAAERHLTVLGAGVLLLVAWGFQLAIPRLLYSTSGAAYGAGYIDAHIRLPVMQILTWITILGALALLANLFFRVRWVPVGIVGIWLVVAFLGGYLLPPLLQRVLVEPNELARERDFIVHSIHGTRAAFGLDRIVEADYDIPEQTIPLDMEANQSTFKNIRLWDYRPLLRTFGQLQEIRLYYNFTDVDVDRYRLDDDYRQVTLSAREIDQNELPDTAQTWVNRHLVYTHGSGVVLSPVNEVLEEGLPNLWVRDIPPRSIHPELALTRPEIYYGELTNDYVLVKTRVQELDYPSGDSNVYTTYEGTSGIVLDSLVKRLAYAIRLGSSQILLSSAITPESELLWRRSIDERVQAVAPFLRYDSDPYLVIVDGRLVWLLDAYTATSRYPYSEPIQTSLGEINYLRNSVKIALDAYDGTLRFYLIDPKDPVAATYAAIFPDLFHPVEEMDPALTAHWRYPEGMFRIQAAKYQIYHMTDPQVFYNQEDLWSWAEDRATGQQAPIEPYYVIMRLPGEQEPEFVLMMPYTPSTKQNMVAWIYARSDGEQYGQIGVYKFPKQRLVYGPMQVESRIDQDPVISQQLSLWNQRGSQVLRGNLLIIPVDRAILYVEPLYLQAESSQLPELRRVIVAYGSRIAMTETLAEGLARVTGASPAPITETPVEPGVQAPPIEGSPGDLALQADALFQSAQDCLTVGDWTCYGQRMEELEEVLQALVRLTQE